MASKDHRRHRRVRVRDIAAHVDAKQGFVTCMAENLSRGGVFLRTSQPMPAGSEIRLHLVRPGMKKALRLGGRVDNAVDDAHARESGARPGMGVSFENLDPDTARRLDQLLQALGIADEQRPTPLPPPGAPPAPRAATTGARAVPAVLVPVASPAPEPSESSPADMSSPEAFEPAPVPPPQATTGGSSPSRSAPVLPVPTWSPTLRATARRVPPPAAPGRSPSEPSDAVRVSVSAPPAGAAPHPGAPGDTGRLMVQIRGLLMQLGETEERLRARDAEVEQLRREVAELRQALAERDGEIAVLAGRSA